MIEVEAMVAVAMRSMVNREVDKRKHPEVMAKRGRATVRSQQQQNQVVAAAAATAAASKASDGGHEGQRDCISFMLSC